MVKNEVEKFDESIIRDRIYLIRGYQVMLDSDLAELYGVEVKYINRAVKRNTDRFPAKFCFMLNSREISNLKCQFGTSSWGGKRKQPTVFTELSIKIMCAFIEMRKFIQTNGHIFQRVDNLEIKLIETDKKVEKILDAMDSGDLKPKQGIFFDGQVFDAYTFVSDLFRSAKKCIVIIDNYIDDSVLVHLTAVAKGVKVKILTKSISDKLALDIHKFSEQYFHVEAKVFTLAHDRFIIIDDKDVYHFGASLKDLGKKWFAFSKIEKSDLELLSKLEKLK
ncbi:MAG TPA: ORF6N domain-containing protein [Clostridiales bacterium]|nr:ORF6N domain-containing protein [Clostridiales bacterium]HQP70975.1 ORF6N domain-containing protein [Clostridiales bacterium]